MISPPPTRLCCGFKHYGSICPDGKVMCTLCYERVDIDDLNVVSIDFEGQHEDVCRSCAIKEREASCRVCRLPIADHKMWCVPKEELPPSRYEDRD